MLMNRPCDCGLRAVQSCAPLSVECWPERGSDYAGDIVGLLSADTTNSSAAVHEPMTALTTVASSNTPSRITGARAAKYGGDWIGHHGNVLLLGGNSFGVNRDAVDQP
jgi:hypothetical protein